MRWLLLVVWVGAGWGATILIYSEQYVYGAICFILCIAVLTKWIFKMFSV